MSWDDDYDDYYDNDSYESWDDYVDDNYGGDYEQAEDDWGERINDYSYSVSSASRNKQYNYSSTSRNEQSRILSYGFDTWNKGVYTKLVGVTYNGRQYYIPQLRKGQELRAVHQSDNAYDRNAIELFDLANNSIGHISKELASSLAPLMDKGYKIKVIVKQITGGNGYNYGVNVFITVNKDTPNISSKTNYSTNSYSNSSKLNRSSNYSDTDSDIQRNYSYYLLGLIGIVMCLFCMSYYVTQQLHKEIPISEDMMTSNLSLGGIDLDISVDEMRERIGAEKDFYISTKYKCYCYENLKVYANKDTNKIIGIESENPKAITKTGLHPAANWKLVAETYGNNYKSFFVNNCSKKGYTTEINAYEFDSCDGRKGVIQFEKHYNSDNIAKIMVYIQHDFSPSYWWYGHAEK